MASLEFNFGRWEFAEIWLSNFYDYEFSDLNELLSTNGIIYG